MQRNSCCGEQSSHWRAMIGRWCVVVEMVQMMHVMVFASWLSPVGLHWDSSVAYDSYLTSNNAMNIAIG